MMLTCSQCGVKKKELNFNKSTKNKSGKRSDCRECQRKSAVAYRLRMGLSSKRKKREKKVLPVMPKKNRTPAMKKFMKQRKELIIKFANKYKKREDLSPLDLYLENDLVLEKGLLGEEKEEILPALGIQNTVN